MTGDLADPRGPIFAHRGRAEILARFVAGGVPLGRQAKPADIAPACVLLASGGGRDITAKAASTDGGVTS